MNAVAMLPGSAVWVLSLVHFLWQGLVIAVVAAASARLFRRGDGRYRCLLCGLALMAACPPLTATWIASTSRDAGWVEAAGMRTSGEASAVGGFAGAVGPGGFAGRMSRLGLGPRWMLAATRDAALPDRSATLQGWCIAAPWVLAAYLAGVSFMFLRLAVGLHGGLRLRAGARPIRRRGVAEALRRQAALLGLKTIPWLAKSTSVAAPVMIGVLKPTILLPAALLSGCTIDRLELVIAHELAHFRRHDHVVNLVQRIVESLLFFHPAVWWISGRIRDLREQCCDDLLVATGADRDCYASTLLIVAEQARGLGGSRRIPALGVAATGRPSMLRQRVMRILGEPTTDPMLPARGAWTAAVVALAFTFAAGARIESAMPLALALPRADIESWWPSRAPTRLGTDLLRHGDQLNAVAASPVGPIVAAGARDGSLGLWRADDGTAIRYVKKRGPIFSVCFSADGRTLAVGTRRAIRVVDVLDGRERRIDDTPAGDVLGVAISPDGGMLASTGAEGRVVIRRLSDGGTLRECLGHRDAAVALAWASDSKTLASAGRDGVVRIWEAASASEVRSLVHPAAVAAVRFAPDDRTLATGAADGTVRIWSTAGEQLAMWPAHPEAVTSLAFSRDGTMLVTGGRDDKVGVWDVESGRRLHSCAPRSGWVTGVDVLRDGNRLVSVGHNGVIRLWDLATGRESLPLDGSDSPVSSVAISGDSRIVFSGCFDGSVRCWESATAKEVRQFVGHRRAVLGVALSGNGAVLATASRDRTVRLWDAATGGQRWIGEGHTGWVLAVAISRDGRLVASGGRDGTARTWNAATGAMTGVLGGHRGNVAAVAFSPDGSLLATGDDADEIHLWRVSTGERLRPCHDEAGRGGVCSLAFSRDGSTLISGHVDGSLVTWEVASARRMQAVPVGHGEVRGIAASWNGGTLAVANEDGTLSVWDLDGDHAVRTASGQRGYGHAVAVSDDGSVIATANTDKTVVVWDNRR